MQRDAPTFTVPVEVADSICEYVWQNSSSHTQCKHLYDSISAAHPVLHQIILRIAIHFVIFDCITRASLREAAAFYRLRAIEYARLKGLPDDQQDLFQTVFRRSHVRVVGLFRESSPRDVSEPSSSNFDWPIEMFRSIIQDCTSFTLVFSRPHVELHRSRIPSLMTLLATFPSLTHLYLDVFMFDDLSSGPNYGPINIFPSITFPSITFLGIRAYPPYIPDPHFKSHSKYLPTRLFEALPNLRHLHLGDPVFLKSVKVPHSLETLTLEAPPAQWIAGREPYSTIMGYNIPAALSHGFLRWRTRPRKQRSIVVHTGAKDPLGWTRAMSSCAEAGVRLSKVVSYL